MSTPVSSVRNLGPTFEQASQRAGIDPAEAPRAQMPLIQNYCNLAPGRISLDITLW